MRPIANACWQTWYDACVSMPTGHCETFSNNDNSGDNTHTITLSIRSSMVLFASSTCCLVPDMMQRRSPGASPLPWMNCSLHPVSPWIFLIISPPLPITTPTAVFGTNTSACSPPIGGAPFPWLNWFGRLLLLYASLSNIKSNTSCLACSTFPGSPEMRRGFSWKNECRTKEMRISVNWTKKSSNLFAQQTLARGRGKSYQLLSRPILDDDHFGTGLFLQHLNGFATFANDQTNFWARNHYL